MPKIHVLKTITIQAPIDKVYATLNNFNHWTAWSPWLIMDPEAEVKVAGDGKSYQWLGTRVGEGNMQILAEQQNKQIDYALNFLKPWKSKAQVSFSLLEQNNSVQVSWSMDSQLPFFLFWMKKMMVAFIGMDYTRGLNMLKEVIETEQVSSKLDFKGISNFPTCNYVGIKTSCSQADIGDAMKRDFEQLQDYIKSLEEKPNTQPFSIYHKWNILKQSVEYTAAVPVAQVPTVLPAGLIAGVMPSNKVYTLRHTGSYQHLGNAWSTLYNMQQNKEIKCQKNQHPFEVYINDPAVTEPQNLITEVHFPIK